jgi:hypothetical protein
MKLKYILSILFLTLLSVNTFASLNDSQFYYSNDNDKISGTTLIDSASNFNGTLVGSITTGVTGKINEAVQTGSSGGYIDTNYNSVLTDYAVDFWIKCDVSDISAGDVVYAVRKNANDRLYLEFDSSGRIRINDKRSGITAISSYTSSICDNTLKYITVNSEKNGDSKIYINTVEAVSVSTPNTNLDMAYDLFIGASNFENGGASSQSNIIIDEFAFYNRTLNSSEISQRYNSGNGFNPFTPGGSIVTNISNYYDTTNISIQVNASESTSLNYSLNGATNVSLGTTEQFNFSIIGVEGQNNISFYFDDGNLTETFIVDTINPVINISNNLEFNSYSVDNEDVFNYSDDNLGSCNVEYLGTNYTCLENITYSFNGNQTVKLYVEDLAGNQISENITVFINPYQYFRFYDTIRAKYVENVTFGNYTTNNSYISIPTYDLGLGEHTLLFDSVGFERKNFTIEFVNNSQINTTLNVSPAMLNINFFDESTRNSLSNVDVEIRNSTKINTYSGVNSLTLYSENSSNVLGELEITVSKENYSARTYSINLDPFSVVNLDVYLLESNSGNFIDFYIYDSTSQVEENALISIYQTINGSDRVIEQVLTDAGGYGGVFIDTTKKNQYFIVSKDGFVQQQYEIRPTTTEYKVYLKVLSDIWEPWNSEVSRQIQLHSSKKEPVNVTYSLVNGNNDFTLWGLNVYDNTNSLIYSVDSTANSGGSLSFVDVTNSTYLRIVYFYQIGNLQDTIEKRYYYFPPQRFNSTGSLNVINLTSQYAETDEVRSDVKAFVFLMILVFVMASPRIVPQLEGRGYGLYLGYGITLLWAFAGGMHWGLATIAMLGTAIIHFDMKKEGRI